MQLVNGRLAWQDPLEMNLGSVSVIMNWGVEGRSADFSVSHMSACI